MEQFQALWPQGATAAAFQGQPMFCGIIRVMFPETAHLSETVPHVDCLPAQSLSCSSNSAPISILKRRLREAN